MDLHAPRISIQWREQTTDRTLLRSHGDSLEIFAAETTVIPAKSDLHIALPAAFSSEDPDHMVEITVNHIRVKTTAPYTEGDLNLHVRNEMAKRKVTFQKGKPMVTVRLVRRPADIPDVFLTPRNPLAWTPESISSDWPDIPILFQTLKSTATCPRRTPSAAGWDLFAAETTIVPPGGQTNISTGTAIAIPTGYRGTLHGRPGLAANHAVHTPNEVIDSTFCGELEVLLFNHGRRNFNVRQGDRIAQLLINAAPAHPWQQTDCLNKTASIETPHIQTPRILTPTANHPDPRAWLLNPKYRDEILTLWGPYGPDYCQDPDAFSRDWSEHIGWVQPMLVDGFYPRVIDKILADTATATVIAPIRPSKQWFKDLVRMSTDYPRLLPYSEDLYLRNKNLQCAPEPLPIETVAFHVSADRARQQAFHSKFKDDTLTPLVRFAGRFANGKRLPYYHLHSGGIVKFDAKIHGENTPSTDVLDINTVSLPVNESGCKSLALVPKRLSKAYGQLTVNNAPVASLLDSGAQADLMSLAFYKKHCRRLPLLRHRTYLSGFNGSRQATEGVVHVRTKFGDRLVVVPYTVVDGIGENVLIGHPTMQAIGIDIINSRGKILVASRDRYGPPSEIPRADCPTTVDCTAQIRSMETVSLPAFSERNFLDAKLNMPVKPGSDIIVDALPDTLSVRPMRCIVRTSDGIHVQIPVANMSKKACRIKRGHAVALFELVPTDEVNLVEMGDLQTLFTDKSANASHPVSNQPVPGVTLARDSAILARDGATPDTILNEPPQINAIEMAEIDKTVKELRADLSTFNWDGIPKDLHIGHGIDGLPADKVQTLIDLIREQTEAGIFRTAVNPGTVDPNVAIHRIPTGDARPISQNPRRNAPLKRQEITAQVQAMLKEGVIRPSVGPWAAPIVLAKKKDGKWRFCVDYRELNKVTQKDVYPLPRIDDTVDALNGARYLTAFDLLSGYWQVPLAPEDAQKTAFATHDGLFQWTCMPFGLTSAPATFQRMMDTVLAGLKWQCCLVYLDDVLVFSRTFEQHISDLCAVFERLQNAGLKLKPSKCHFCCTDIKYLGYIITPNGIKPDTDNLKAVADMREPCNVSEVRTYLGMTGHYRQFIANYAQISKPLRELTSPNTEWKFADSERLAFSTLRDALISAPILALPDFTREFQFTLQTDASDEGLGAVLSQKGRDGKLHPVAFASRALTASELKYHTQEKEALGIMWACEKFRPYLLGETFDVETDHGSLKWLMGTQKGRLSRWAMRLSEFDLTIKPKPGTANGNADGPSRFPVDKPDENWSPDDSAPDYTDLFPGGGPLNVTMVNLTTDAATAHAQITSVDVTEVHTVTTTEDDAQPSPDLALKTLRTRLIRHQDRDNNYRSLKSEILQRQARQADGNSLSTPFLAPGSSHAITANAMKRMHVESDGLLTMNARSPSHSYGEKHAITTTWSHRAVVPVTMRTEILRLAHESPLGAHLGKNKVFNALMKTYFWPNMSTDVRTFIKECHRCQLYKRDPRPWARPLRPITLNTRTPFAYVAIDIIVGLPLTLTGFQNICVMSDMFTSWPEAVPMKDKSAESVADAIYTHIICRHGIPHFLQSDQGPEFMGKVVECLKRRMRITHNTTTPYNPQSNGKVENFNKTLSNGLKSYATDENIMTWDKFLDGVLFAYRTTKHATRPYSPFEMLYGRRAQTPLDILDVLPSEEPNHAGFADDIKNYQSRHTYELWRAHECVRAAMTEAQQAYKTYHDGRLHPSAQKIDFAVGDEIMLNQPRLGPAATTAGEKFKPLWLGPFTIVEISRTNDVFTIRNKTNRLLRVKVGHIKRFHPSTSTHYDVAADPPTASFMAQDETSHSLMRPDQRSVTNNCPARLNVGTEAEAANPLKTLLRGTPADLDPPEQPPTHSRSPVPTAVRTAVASKDDPMRRFEIQAIVGHRRYRNAYLYRVRWAPPYDNDSEITEEPERSFDRASLRSLPPALQDYWTHFPIRERPAAYRHLPDVTAHGSNGVAPAASPEHVQATPSRKRRRGKAQPSSGSKRQKSVAPKRN